MSLRSYRIILSTCIIADFMKKSNGLFLAVHRHRLNSHRACITRFYSPSPRGILSGYFITVQSVSSSPMHRKSQGNQHFLRFHVLSSGADPPPGNLSEIRVAWRPGFSLFLHNDLTPPGGMRRTRKNAERLAFPCFPSLTRLSFTLLTVFIKHSFCL